MRNACRDAMLALLMVAFVPICSYGQQYVVKGTITASGIPVRYASVTFVDNSNSSVGYAALTDSTGAFDLGTVTNVKPGNQLPTNFRLEQNYPNPFNSATAISYNLDKQSDVKVTIYDVLGRVVKNYAMGYQDAGAHGIIWSGRNNLGEKVAPGVYFYRLQARGQAVVKKMVYGIGATNAVVSLRGILPSQSAETGGPSTVSAGGASFTVTIVNTDSTYPLIATQVFNNIGVQSDTTFGFSILKLNPAMVYTDSTQQIIRGFGGANALIFRPDMTPAEVQTAFGNGNGQIGMTIMRLSISSDSTQFSANVPSALAAQNLGATIIATPWTPPAWMKSNDNQSGGTLLPANYASYAAYLKSFADTMAAHGVTVNAISVQNEPDASVGYQSCSWNATQFLNFMKNYAPSIGVPVFMPESQSFVHQLSDSTLNDSAAASHVAFIGGHIYGVTPSSYPLALSKGKELWMTEYLINSGNPPTNTSIDTGWAGAMQTAKSINDCMNANMSAYVWWYIVRYYGPIGDGSFGGQAGAVTHKGYVMSQYAKFVRPGYYRVFATANPQAGVYLTAYKGGTKTVIVVVNMNSNPTMQPIAMTNGSAASYTPYVTSSTKNCVQGNIVTVSNGGFTATLDASSVTTFVSN
jgi:glucuronoarabinoxylan endo-1,4-beta-xylanase